MQGGRVQPQRQGHYPGGNRERQPERFDYVKPINNEFKPLVKASAQARGRVAQPRRKSRNQRDANKFRGGSEDKNQMGRVAGKYESDREDDRGMSGGRMAPLRRELEANERVNDSRQSAGSFSELVLEEYDKMNMDPLLGN